MNYRGFLKEIKRNIPDVDLSDRHVDIYLRSAYSHVPKGSSLEETKVYARVLVEGFLGGRLSTNARVMSTLSGLFKKVATKEPRS